MDLVEISPNNNPPVCKIMDYGKFKFQAQKKAAEARKKQKTVEIKEIKLRPMIDDHDYDVKMRAMLRFFEEGDKVKITVMFRGSACATGWPAGAPTIIPRRNRTKLRARKRGCTQ